MTANGAVEHALAEGQTRWPDVSVDAETFGAFLLERVDAEADPAAVIPTLHVTDLYLVCACLVGSERAALRFREHVFDVVEVAVRRIDASSTEDVVQGVYARLFLAEQQRPPKIQHYRGKGDLRRWIGVVASRFAIDMRRSDRTGEPFAAELIERIAGTSDSHELDVLQRTYRREFKQAFAVAVASLDERQRNVLRYQLDGMTADQVGRMYNVHRVTVARWLSRIRQTLLEQTRATLRINLGVDNRDVDSIMRMVDGGISVSMDRLIPPPDRHDVES